MLSDISPFQNDQADFDVEDKDDGEWEEAACDQACPRVHDAEEAVVGREAGARGIGLQDGGVEDVGHAVEGRRRDDDGRRDVGAARTAPAERPQRQADG